MKKIISAVLCVAMLSATAPYAYAYKFPQSFWAMNSGYESATGSGDSYGIIEFGNQEINLMLNEPDCTEKRNLLRSRYKEVGLAYAAVGDYDSSANTFRAMYDYLQNFGTEFEEEAKDAKARAEQYTSVLRLFTEGGTDVYYGAKNEKKNGVLFGACVNGGVRNDLSNESMVLIYHELGQEILPYNADALNKAASSGSAVEIALNCPNEAGDINNIKSKEQNLKELSELFSKHSSMPIYLRFGAEFDIWGNMADPAAFREAYKYVSEYFRTRNSNVAMVWSPNQVSAWNVNIDDFYPGDEYVDWVGISSYAMKYFLSDSGNETAAIHFKTGVNSNPVIVLEDIIKRYGAKKPIMLSECGCGHYVSALGEDTTQFARERMKDYFLYLPMIYKQIKLIAYFDYYNGSEAYNYSLSANAELKNDFLKYTKGRRFVQNSYDDEVSLCYKEVVNGTGVESVFPVSTYANIYKQKITEVTYSIDGVYAAKAVEAPFTSYIDAQGYTGGQHTLTAVAVGDGGGRITSSISINITSPSGNEISVLTNGEKVAFDQKPVIYNSRTMVPMRAIIEKLGATVEWNGETQTVTGIKNGKTVKISVGSDRLYVNGEEKKLDTPAIVLAGRTLVPVRAIAEGFGCKVEWKGETSTVLITE